MSINNFAELNSAIENAIQKALDLTTEELLDKLEDYIQTEVYDVSSMWEDGYMLRTGEFKKSWERFNAKVITKGIIESQIFQNVSIMERIDVPPIHIDRDNLAQIINSGIGYNFGAFEGIARPYWDKFIEWANMHLDEIFVNKCNLVGLPISPTLTNI